MIRFLFHFFWMVLLNVSSVFKGGPRAGAVVFLSGPRRRNPKNCTAESSGLPLPGDSVRWQGAGKAAAAAATTPRLRPATRSYLEICAS